VSGHEFTRAEQAAKKGRALAPAVVQERLRSFQGAQLQLCRNAHRISPASAAEERIFIQSLHPSRAVKIAFLAFVSGHEFTRAVQAAKKGGALVPAVVQGRLRSFQGAQLQLCRNAHRISPASAAEERIFIQSLHPSRAVKLPFWFLCQGTSSLVPYKPQKKAGL
jgi:hypothetical protein